MQVYDIPIASDHREETEHGTYDFPLAVYETQLDKNILGYVNWHWHEEIQFMYVTHGSVKVFVDKEAVVLKEREGIFINSEVFHKTVPEDVPDASFVAVVIHEKMLAGFAGSRVGQKYVVPYLHDENFIYRVLRSEQNVIESLRIINDLFDAGNELDIQLAVLKCWREFVNLSPADPETVANKRDTDRMKTILQIVSARYGEKLTLEDFADEVHLSSGECCRLFKKQMHCTLFEYLLDYRLEKSLKHLQYSDDSISAIAYDCGFSSTSYYIKRFKEKTGMTPLEFRKQR